MNMQNTSSKRQSSNVLQSNKKKHGYKQMSHKTSYKSCTSAQHIQQKCGKIE